MKKSFVLFFFFIFSKSFCQKIEFPINSETMEVEFVKVLNIDSIPKKELFNKSKLWIVDKFKSANSVIQYENQEEGKIVCKGNFKIVSTGNGLNGTIHRTHAGIINFTIDLSCKDGKSRIKIYNIMHEANYAGGSIKNENPDCGNGVMTVKTWNSIQKQAYKHIESLIIQYSTYMMDISSEQKW